MTQDHFYLSICSKLGASFGLNNLSAIEGNY